MALYVALCESQVHKERGYFDTQIVEAPTRFSFPLNQHVPGSLIARLRPVKTMDYVDYEESDGIFTQQNLHPFAYVGHDESPLRHHKIGLRLELLSLKYLQKILRVKEFVISLCDEPRKSQFEERFGIPIEATHPIDEYVERMETVLEQFFNTRSGSLQTIGARR